MSSARLILNRAPYDATEPCPSWLQRKHATFGSSGMDGRDGEYHRADLFSRPTRPPYQSRWLQLLRTDGEHDCPPAMTPTVRLTRISLSLQAAWAYRAIDTTSMYVPPLGDPVRLGLTYLSLVRPVYLAPASSSSDHHTTSTSTAAPFRRARPIRRLSGRSSSTSIVSSRTRRSLPTPTHG